MKITPETQQEQADLISNMYSKLEQRIWSDLLDSLGKSIKRVKDNDMSTWALESLSKMGVLTQQVIDEVADMNPKIEKRLTKLIKDNGIQIVDQVDKEIEFAIRKPYGTVSESTKNVIDSTLNQTFRDLNNTVNQTLLSTNFNQNSAMRAYQEIVKKTVLEVNVGNKTPERALKDTAYKWVANGLKTNLVDRGGHEWSIETYANMVISSSAHRTFNDLRTKRMEEFGMGVALMSSHPASREACAYIQGKPVNIVPRGDERFDERYPSIYDYGYGSPSGTQGINCHHTLTPFDPDSMTNPYKQYDPEEAIQHSKEQSQQRAIERSIRDSKKRENAAIALGDDETARKMRQRLNAQRSKMRRFLDDHPYLSRNRYREQIITPKRPNSHPKPVVKPKPTPKPPVVPKFDPYDAKQTPKGIKVIKGETADWDEVELTARNGRALGKESLRRLSKYSLDDLKNVYGRFMEEDQINELHSWLAKHKKHNGIDLPVKPVEKPVKPKPKAKPTRRKVTKKSPIANKSVNSYLKYTESKHTIGFSLSKKTTDKFEELFGKETLNRVIKGFSKAPDDVMKPINKAMELTKLTKYNGFAEFDEFRNTLSISESEMVENGSRKHNAASTLAHELGHAIDAYSVKPENDIRRITKDRSLSERYDFNKLIRDDLDSTIYENAHREFSSLKKPRKNSKDYDARRKEWLEKQSEILNKIREADEKMQDLYSEHKQAGGEASIYASLSDLWGGSGFIRDTKPFKVGHDKSYWQGKNNNNLGSEAFAEIISAKATYPEEYKLLKKYLPRTVAKVDELLRTTWLRK